MMTNIRLIPLMIKWLMMKMVIIWIRIAMADMDLATGLDPLDEAEGNEEPGCPQATHILPPDNHLMRNPWLEEKL